MSESDPTQQEDFDCPDCDRSFTTYNGLSVHHSRSHEGTIRPEITCENCGETFTVQRSRKDTAKFCSRECQNALEKTECKQCGVEFEYRPSRGRTFCSKRCSQKWHTGRNHPNRKQRINCECEFCGEPLELLPWEDNQSERHFCSEDCRAEWLSEWVEGRFTGEDHWMNNIDPENHPMWAGGSKPYGPGFGPEKKEKVRERDDRECQHCGRSEEEHLEKYGTKHHVHHIQKARHFDDPKKRNDMENLVTLCHGPCHATWERMSPLRPSHVELE